jgi:hypothetical protein
MSCRWLAAVCLAVLTAGCASSPPAAVPVAASDDPVVYVAERGWHTDIGLPVGEITGKLAVLEAGFPGVRFLTFGFGERAFVVNREKNIGSMLNALLPSQSALLMTALKGSPEEAFGSANVVMLHVSRASLGLIEDRLWQELELSGDGAPVWLAGGPYTGSVFYAARDTYSGLYTCNSWTVEMLRAGGLPISATGVLFSGQVMGLARWAGARQALSP